MKTWKVYWILVEFSIYLKPEFKPETRKLKPEPEKLSFAKTRTRPEPEKAKPEIPETRKIATRLSPTKEAKNTAKILVWMQCSAAWRSPNTQGSL